MKLYQPVFGITFCLFLCMGCEWTLPKTCKSSSATEQGIILRKIADGCYPSLNFPENTNRQWVVTTKTEWDSIWTDHAKKYQFTCDTPKVDFNTETVLAFYHGTGHGIKSIHNISRDNAAKKIHYKITDVDCNAGKKRTMEFMVSYHMMVVPKIPSDYSITFELIEGK